MALLYIETFKQSIASVIKQYNLVLAKAAAKRADWACVQDETQAEPLPLALHMDRWIDKHADIF